ALADAEGAIAIELGQDRGDIWAGEALAALPGRVIVAKLHLQIPDGRTESRDVALDDCRQCLHEHEPTEMPRERVGKRRELRKCRRLRLAMHALARGIDNDQHPPVLG